MTGVKETRHRLTGLPVHRPNRVLVALGRFFIRCLMAEQNARMDAVNRQMLDAQMMTSKPVMGPVVPGQMSERDDVFVPRPPSIRRPDKPVYDPLFGSDNGVRRK